MRIALLPSTQYGNAVVGGGTEAEYAQDIARRLKPLLEQSGNECMIFAGQSDANTDGARAAVAWKCELSLSIHSDAGGGVPLGSLICYQEQRSLPFCRSVLDAFCQIMGTANRGYMKRTPGVNGVAVLRIPETVCPACLIETVRHDVASTAALLRDPAWRQRAAQALKVGVVKYAGESEDDMGHSMCRNLAARGTLMEGHAWLGKLGPRTEHCYLHLTGVAKNPAKVAVTCYSDAVVKNVNVLVALNKHIEVNLEDLGVTGAVTWRVQSDEVVLVSPDWRVEW